MDGELSVNKGQNACRKIDFFQSLRRVLLLKEMVGKGTLLKINTNIKCISVTLIMRDEKQQEFFNNIWDAQCMRNAVKRQPFVVMTQWSKMGNDSYEFGHFLDLYLLFVFGGSFDSFGINEHF